jgi:hypothetical protein
MPFIPNYNVSGSMMILKQYVTLDSSTDSGLHGTDLDEQQLK